ncbi:MAG: hypothetical protein O3B74_05700 [Proteobacteria bacterium]|nr:hypothetical protein [Pseudomonadota bacterium]
MPATTDGKQRCVFRRRRDNLLDIGDTHRPHDRGGSPIRHPIPNTPGAIIVIVARIDNFPLDPP